MWTNFQISSLVPSGFVAESVSVSSDSILLVARSNAGIATCPLCGSASRRVHSKYARYVSDLPCSGREIRLRVLTRRFLCEVEHCRRRIFAERFGENILPVRSRRTARMDHIIRHLGLSLGGRPAASFAKRLMLPVSNDTLLRVVRRGLHTHALIAASNALVPTIFMTRVRL
jgi:hypothetical protein